MSSSARGVCFCFVCCVEPIKYFPNRTVVTKGRVLCVLSERNPLRQLMCRVVAHSWFDNGILSMIGVSCVCLVLDNPLLYPEVGREDSVSRK